MAVATDEALWRIAIGLEERGVFLQRLPSLEEYRRVKAALRSAEDFSRLINHRGNSPLFVIPEFSLNFRVRALLSDQVMAESLFPGRAPILSAATAVKQAEDDYDAPIEPPRPAGPPVAKYPLDDMYYTLEENHEDWLMHQELHGRERPPISQSSSREAPLIKAETQETQPQPPAALPVPAPKESVDSMMIDQASEDIKKDLRESKADPSSDSRRAEKEEDDDEEGDDSDEEDDEKGGRRKRDRNSSNKSSRELRSLLSDVKLAKKWANCAIPTQAELYEALDNVLKQARDLKDYSYPFLRPVRRADAPDYYSRIKTPMDFKTMAKKLRKAEYNSKKEFQADLSLIYSNCRKYNTDADSPYRKCADEVEALTKKLMQEVPAIDITQARKEVMAKAKEDGQTAPPPDSPKSPSSEGEAPPKKKSKARTRGGKKEEESPQVSKESSGVVPEAPPAATNSRSKARRSDGSTGQPSPAAPLKEEKEAPSKAQQTQQQQKELELKKAEEAKKAAEAAARKTAEQKRAEEELRRAQRQPERLVDPQLRQWREITREERVRFVSYRMQQNSIPFSDRDALVRSPDGMATYTNSANVAPQVKTGLGFFPEYSHPASCVPDLPQPSVSNPSRQYPNFAENSAALRNTQRLARIRELRNRLLPDLGDGPAPPEEPLPSLSTGVAPSHYTEKLNAAILRKSLIVLLAHAGFQASSRNALDVLTDVVQQFYRKLCRVVRLRLQEPIPSGDVEDPLHHALVEMGASGYQALRQYFLSSVVQYGRRLEDLEARLTSRVERAAQFATAEAAPEEELEEDDVAFLSGTFGEGVQLDVLGLGELGMEGVAVPAQLLAPGAAQRKRKLVAAKPSPGPAGDVPQTPAEEPEGEEEGEEGEEEEDDESYDEDEEDDRKRKHLSSGFLPQKKTRPDEGLLT